MSAPKQFRIGDVVVTVSNTGEIASGPHRITRVEMDDNGVDQWVEWDPASHPLQCCGGMVEPLRVRLYRSVLQ